MICRSRGVSRSVEVAGSWGVGLGSAVVVCDHLPAGGRVARLGSLWGLDSPDSRRFPGKMEVRASSTGFEVASGGARSGPG